MFKIVIPEREYYNEDTNEFIKVNEKTLELEHSLASISEYEMRTNKAFFSNDSKSVFESIEYVKCMTLNKGIDPLVYDGITQKNFEEIGKYLDKPMTATWFSDVKKKGNNKEIITSEIIYYWMTALNIPFECQYWNLNRLLVLIRVCNTKQEVPKKIRGKELAKSNSTLNSIRRKNIGTNG